MGTLCTEASEGRVGVCGSWDGSHSSVWYHSAVSGMQWFVVWVSEDVCVCVHTEQWEERVWEQVGCMCLANSGMQV